MRKVIVLLLVLLGCGEPGAELEAPASPQVSELLQPLLSSSCDQINSNNGKLLSAEGSDKLAGLRGVQMGVCCGCGKNEFQCSGDQCFHYGALSSEVKGCFDHSPSGSRFCVFRWAATDTLQYTFNYTRGTRYAWLYPKWVYDNYKSGRTNGNEFLCPASRIDIVASKLESYNYPSGGCKKLCDQYGGCRP